MIPELRPRAAEGHNLAHEDFRKACNGEACLERDQDVVVNVIKKVVLDAFEGILGN